MAAGDAAGRTPRPDGGYSMQTRDWLCCLGFAATVAILGVSVPAGPAGAASPIPSHNEPMASHSTLRPGKWCADYRLGQLSDRQRLEGANLTRLQAAQDEIAPGFVAGRARTGLVLLADYQQELEKRRPNMSLAAMYLAMSSAVPITPGRLQRVNRLLCISVTRSHARSIVAEAEAARRQMSK